MTPPSDDPTKPDTKLSNLIADGVESRLKKPEFVDAIAARVAVHVAAELGAWRHDVDEDRSSTRIQLQDHESRIRHLERLLDASRAPTEPPGPNGAHS